MMHLGQSILRKGTATRIEDAIKQIQMVTASDILDVANEILQEQQFSQLLYVPED